MINRFSCLLIVVAMASCNISNNPGNQQNEEIAAVQAPMVESGNAANDGANSEPTTDTAKYVDSFEIQMDSLMDAKISLPPVYMHDVLSANDEAAAKFTELAKASHGKMKILVNSSQVAKEVAHTINSISVQNSDLLILIDKTYSMLKDVNNVKASLGQIIDTIRKYKGTRLAVAFYGDKNEDGMGWYSFKNFETDYGKAQQYIDSLVVDGGGDIPESVYDAVVKSFEQDFWKSTKKRNIILVGDAPPLEKPLSDYAMSDVVAKARAGAVNMNFYPIIIMPEIAEVRIDPTELRKYEPIKLTTSLYPNPTRGHIDVGFAENGTYYMELYNVAGVMVVSEETYGISWGKDLGDQPDGMYILRVINPEHKFEMIKFILRH